MLMDVVAGHETCLCCAKEPYTCAKEPYTFAKEPYTNRKEP